MKMVQAIIVTLMLSLALFIPGVVQAFTFDLYETLENTPSGTACNICSVLELPEDVYGGYVVLLDSMGSLADTSTWRNVIVWGSTVIGGVLQGSTDPNVGDFDVQLLSKGCACFPSLAQVTAGYYFDQFATPPVTFYDAYIIQPGDSNKYYIHTAQVPEPSSLFLLGSGLTAVGLWRRFKLKRSQESA